MKPVTYLILHSKDSTAGSAPDWLHARSHFFETLIAPNVEVWPKLRQGDSIITLGGDMEVWETEKHPWLLDEKAFIRSAIALEVPVYGICLGSQLLAEALGAEVRPGEKWEIGWRPVQLKNSGETRMPFHCHSSTFTLPPNAKILATNEFSNQGFEYNSIFVGYQFHNEIDQSRLIKIYAEWDSTREGSVDSLVATQEKTPLHIGALREFFFGELDRWFAAWPLENQDVTTGHP